MPAGRHPTRYQKKIRLLAEKRIIIIIFYHIGHQAQWLASNFLIFITFLPDFSQEIFNGLLRNLGSNNKPLLMKSSLSAKSRLVSLMQTGLPDIDRNDPVGVR
jgi:hypothetical protein